MKKILEEKYRKYHEKISELRNFDSLCTPFATCMKCMFKGECLGDDEFSCCEYLYCYIKYHDLFLDEELLQEVENSESFAGFEKNKICANCKFKEAVFLGECSILYYALKEYITITENNVGTELNYDKMMARLDALEKKMDIVIGMLINKK